MTRKIIAASLAGRGKSMLALFCDDSSDCASQKNKTRYGGIRNGSFKS